MDKIIASEDLRTFEMALFLKVGIPIERAEVLSNCLVEADLQGITSHGAIRIPIYLRRIHDNLTDLTSNISIIEDYPATAVLDGKNVIGQIASEQAMSLTIEKAGDFGIGCVALRNTNHSGTCSHYSMMAARQNMVGFAFVNTTPLVAVFGGTRKAVGNNPLSIAIPAGKYDPIVLDMACSVAQGKIELLQKQGHQIPIGWAVDEDGNQTTDPAKALKGVLLPIAGPKGSGLAIAIDILCGILSGSGVGNEICHLNDPMPQNLGAFFIAIDISKFTSTKVFHERVDKYIEYLKGTAKKTEQILMPGEIAFITHRERAKNGIPFPKTLVDELNALAEQHGIEKRL